MKSTRNIIIHVSYRMYGMVHTNHIHFHDVYGMYGMYGIVRYHTYLVGEDAHLVYLFNTVAMSRLLRK